MVDHFVLPALSSVSSARGSGWVGGWVSEQRRHTGALPTIVCKFKFLLHQIYRQWPALLLMDECLCMVIFWKSEIYCVKLICAPWVKGVDGLGTEDQSATCFVCQYKVWFGFGRSLRQYKSKNKFPQIIFDIGDWLTNLIVVGLCSVLLSPHTVYLRLKD